jgi:hypothetical protein
MTNQANSDGRGPYYTLIGKNSGSGLDIKGIIIGANAACRGVWFAKRLPKHFPVPVHLHKKVSMAMNVDQEAIEDQPANFIRHNSDSTTDKWLIREIHLSPTNTCLDFKDLNCAFIEIGMYF